MKFNFPSAWLQTGGTSFDLAASPAFEARCGIFTSAFFAEFNGRPAQNGSQRANGESTPIPNHEICWICPRFNLSGMSPARTGAGCS
jgi:hypothetical protein